MKQSPRAKLRDGLYVKAFAFLEPAEWMVGRREVWTSTHGRATRYHVMVDHGFAACRASSDQRNRTVILLTDLMSIGDVPAHMACMRNGCRQLFSRFLGHTL